MYLTLLKRYELMLGAVFMLVALWFLNRSLMMPAIFIAGYILIVYDYLLENIKIRSPRRLLVPQRKGRIFVLLIRGVLVLQGFILLSSGAGETDSVIDFRGIDVKVFAGILLMLAGLLRNRRYHFLLTPHSITFNDHLGWSEWKIKDISRFVIGKNSMVFYKGEISREIRFPDTGKDYSALISARLKQMWAERAG